MSYYGLSEIPVYRCAFRYLSSSIISYYHGPKVFVSYFGPSAQEKYVQAPLYYVRTPLRRDRHEITQMSDSYFELLSGSGKLRTYRHVGNSAQTVRRMTRVQQ